MKEGNKAPAFSLRGSDGKLHNLQEFRGKTLVLYFYPRDDTPGCTIEAKEFTEQFDRIAGMGATVVGVSKDDLDSHSRFCSKYGLRILLLSDPSSEVIKAYGAYGSRGVFGMGTLRNTYIIDSNGIIVKAFDRVRANGHASEVLSFLKGMKSAGK